MTLSFGKGYITFYKSIQDKRVKTLGKIMKWEYHMQLLLKKATIRAVILEIRR
jgi:hypothetical protein